MNLWSAWNLAATVSFNANRSAVCAITAPQSALVRMYFDPRNVHATRNVYLEEGERRWPMPRLPNNPDRDFSASQSEDDINADIAELFASRPVGIVELFADPIVRMRIGSLIRDAMNRPTRFRRRVKLDSLSLDQRSRA
jgi:hypothetical protein